MNYLDKELLRKANEEAIYNVYMYLAHKSVPKEKETFKSIVHTLEENFKNHRGQLWSEREKRQLRILKNALRFNGNLANSVIEGLTVSKSLMTACCFLKPDKSISVVFKGTGEDEWIDNGEGLSGKSEENTYIFYEIGRGETGRKTVYNDFATDSQVDALNWFYMTAAKCGWEEDVQITVSGHSKGGNKAQFVTINSMRPSLCLSFDGQGFSPEALKAFKNKLGAQYEKRRQCIHSFAAENDYVNVLGTPLVPESNMYYFKSRIGIHPMDAILTDAGRLRRQCEQGAFSVYVQGVSAQLMQTPPHLRHPLTTTVMSFFQKDK